MIRRWLALTYYLYALRLAALSHFILIHYIFSVQAAFCVRLCVAEMLPNRFAGGRQFGADAHHRAAVSAFLVEIAAEAGEQAVTLRQ